MNGTERRVRLSVIVATRNAASSIDGCLSSLFSQEVEGLEVLVADGASTDGTVERLEHHSACLAWWESRPDQGIYDAWNRALEHAAGEWIVFLGADDRLVSPASLGCLLSRCDAALESGIRVVYGRSALVSPQGRTIKWLGRPWALEARRFRAGIMRLPHPGLFHHRSLFEEHGRFDGRFRIAGDYELLLRELRDREALFVEGCRVALIRTGGVSDTPAGRLAGLREVLAARRKWGVRGLPPRLIAALSKAALLALVR